METLLRSFTVPLLGMRNGSAKYADCSRLCTLPNFMMQIWEAAILLRCGGLSSVPGGSSRTLVTGGCKASFESTELLPESQ